MMPAHSPTSAAVLSSTFVSFGVPKRAPSMACASEKTFTSTWREMSVRS